MPQVDYGLTDYKDEQINIIFILIRIKMTKYLSIKYIEYIYKTDVNILKNTIVFLRISFS